jgi:hypothetical protein
MTSILKCAGKIVKNRCQFCSKRSLFAQDMGKVDFRWIIKTSIKYF